MSPMATKVSFSETYNILDNLKIIYALVMTYNVIVIIFNEIIDNKIEKVSYVLHHNFYQ